MTEDVLAGGLLLARLLPVEEPAAVRRVGPWLTATIAERLLLPPAGIVADVGALLAGASLRRPAPEADAELAGAIRRYEDAVLGRLAEDARLAAAGLRVAPAHHAAAVGILVDALCRSTGYVAGRAMEPAVVRRATAETADATIARGRVALERPEVRAELVADYLAFARGALRARRLLAEADLFAIEHLEVLATRAQRLAIGDVVRAEAAIRAAMPRRIPRRRRHEGDVHTALEDESAYPVGGFASMSTSGTLENLVTSELVYMDPPGTEVDLFELRWVEGELLYYTRDEAVLVRRRRVIVIALPSSLAAHRVKDPDAPWQRLVLALGGVMLLVHRLVELLGEEALELRLAFGAGLEEERALTELLLRDERGRGLVQVTDEGAPAPPLSLHVDVSLAATLGVEGWAGFCAEALARLL